MLSGRVAVVTGVSRRAGIGFAVVRRLLDDGATVLCQSWAPHDAGHPWGADPLGPAGVVAALGTPAEQLAHTELDLAEPNAPQGLFDQARELFGHVDILIANHAHSAEGRLEEVTADELDRAWAVNARASVLLTQAFAAQHDNRPGGRVVLFTSGDRKSVV